MVVEDLNHLLPEVRELVELPNWERVNHIKKDIWIGYPTAMKALEKLNGPVLIE